MTDRDRLMAYKDQKTQMERCNTAASAGYDAENKAKSLNTVELFISYLIDNHERDMITEEGLQQVYTDFRKWFDARFGLAS